MHKKTGAVVNKVEEGSIAEELGIKQGDIILKLNEVKPMDLIDYQFLCKTEDLTIETETEIFEIEKDFDEDLGIVFESAIFDKIKPCKNKCVFCFVDQQPKGLRKSLYVKDDDYRLSYLQGTYITLTNLTNEDKTRIQNLHLGPLFVSIHTTNPKLRAEMLKNPNAAGILDELKWLKKYQIPIHAQIVLCPNYNDGVELENTLNDLAKFKDIILSIAIVPVGITKYRKEEILPVTKKIAQETLSQIENFNEKVKKQLAMASDEFFLLANEPIPGKKYYGNFSQIEDGVGSFRLVLDDFEKRKNKLPKKLKNRKSFHLITSKSAGYVFKEIAKTLNRIENLTFNLVEVESNFWGEKINVAGLIVARDIIDQLMPIKKDIDTIIIPSVMLQPLSQSFLDDLTVTDLKKALECEVEIVGDYYSTEEIVRLISQ